MVERNMRKKILTCEKINRDEVKIQMRWISAWRSSSFLVNKPKYIIKYDDKPR